MTESRFARAAVALARRGVAVFPLCPGTRIPLRGSHGCNDATTDEAQVQAWWREGPDRNIACSLVRSGLVVLDVDLHDPTKDGFGSLAAVQAEHGELPATATAATPRGGLHLYFRRPAGLDLETKPGFRPGLDGLVTQAVLPPTVRPHGSYRWTTRGVPIAEAPTWFLDVLRRPPPPPLPAARVVRSSSAWAAAVLRNAGDRVASAAPGTRDAVLSREAYSLGGYVGGGALDADDTADVLIRAGVAAGNPVAQVTATVRRGLRRGMAAPRRVELRSAGGAA